MASASSRIISLKFAVELVVVAEEEELEEESVKICFVLANVLICSRTTSMPRSSEALSSRTIWRMFFAP